MRGRSYIKEVLEKQNDLRKEIPTIGREMDSWQILWTFPYYVTLQKAVSIAAIIK